jgi:hypothetical protein
MAKLLCDNVSLHSSPREMANKSRSWVDRDMFMRYLGGGIGHVAQETSLPDDELPLDSDEAEPGPENLNEELVSQTNLDGMIPADGDDDDEQEASDDSEEEEDDDHEERPRDPDSDSENDEDMEDLDLEADSDDDNSGFADL